ncbi:MAG: hypothetical protein KKA90_04765 [Nanoarchaeota archaeon]|nr:hypothetical protein [Nanoarchaeota archaeon]
MGFNIFGELKVIWDHYRFRVIKRTRPLHVHTEALYKDTVWKRVQDFVNSGKSAIWYCLTPVNYDYIKVELGCHLSKEEYEKTIIERYRWLAAHGQKIQLHVHMRVLPQLYETQQESRAFQEEKLSWAVEWMKKHGFLMSELVYGWWSEDENSRFLAKKHNLALQNRFEHYYIHDYDFLLNPNPI